MTRERIATRIGRSMPRRLWLAIVAFGMCQPAQAQFEYAISGFGTLGYATSNRSETYDRFISDRGTWMSDTVAGLQIDAKAFREFGATVQFKVAPFTDKDNRYTGSVSWAFGSWRPADDWLVRIGKQRIPYYLYSQSLDVGASYDFARLPIEMYSISAADDFIGGSVGRSWHFTDSEASLDGYAGYAPNNFRYWARDSIPGLQNAGAQFNKLKLRGIGFVATYKDDDHLFRFSALRAIVQNANGVEFPATIPYVQIAPTIGYYQVSNALPGPGLQPVKKVRNTLITFGFNSALPMQFRMIGEFERTIAEGTPFSPRGNRGYAALQRRVDKWTPYVYYAFLRSPQSQIDQYTSINDSVLPSFIPGAAQINAAQRAAVDQDDVFQQSSWAFGASYSVTPASKLKLEYLKTRVGAVSQLVDAPPGATPRHLKIGTFSLSYSMVFQ